VALYCCDFAGASYFLDDIKMIRRLLHIFFIHDYGNWYESQALTTSFGDRSYWKTCRVCGKTKHIRVERI